MNDAVNSVVNNLADRFGEVVEVVSPALENVGAISQTVVQETANSGFTYTMVGCGMVGIACLATIGIVWAMRRIEDSDRRECVIGGLIAIALAFALIGISTSLSNIKNWCAPTREVVREVVGNLQE